MSILMQTNILKYLKYVITSDIGMTGRRSTLTHRPQSGLGAGPSEGD